MIYTVFIRQIREVHIQAQDATQLRFIMEQSFKPEEHSELEEWRCHSATNPDGTTCSADIDMCWRKFPETGENDENA